MRMILENQNAESSKKKDWELNESFNWMKKGIKSYDPKKEKKKLYLQIEF